MSTTARNIPADGFRTRQRLLASGVSETMLVARTGLGPSYFRSLLNRNEINTSATLADIRKMLAMLGMTWGDLLDPTPYGPQHDPALTTDDDPATLGNLLSRNNKARKPEALATALGWTLDRINTARDTLDKRLAPAGMRVHDTIVTGWKLAPYDGTVDAASTRLDQLQDHIRTPNSAMLRVLYAIWTDTLSTREIKDVHKVHLHSLLNRRILSAATEKGRYSLSPETLHALDF